MRNSWWCNNNFLKEKYTNTNILLTIYHQLSKLRVNNTGSNVDRVSFGFSYGNY